MSSATAHSMQDDEQGGWEFEPEDVCEKNYKYLLQFHENVI